MINKTIYILIIAFFIFSCGTDTGNPTLTNGTPVSSITPLTIQISYSICTKIRSCFNPALSNCETKIRTAVNMPTYLGLNESTYPNFDTIQISIDALSLQTDNVKRNTCFQSISNSACSISQVQQSYNSSDLENLTQAWKLLTIDSNCSQFIY